MTTEAQHSPKGPNKLAAVSKVTKVPEQAKRTVGWLVEELKDTYIIDYVANSPSEYSRCPCEFRLWSLKPKKTPTA